jgi:hypothetical protein
VKPVATNQKVSVRDRNSNDNQCLNIGTKDEQITVKIGWVRRIPLQETIKY